MDWSRGAAISTQADQHLVVRSLGLQYREKCRWRGTQFIKVLQEWFRTIDGTWRPLTCPDIFYKTTNIDFELPEYLIRNIAMITLKAHVENNFPIYSVNKFNTPVKGTLLPLLTQLHFVTARLWQWQCEKKCMSASCFFYLRHTLYGNPKRTILMLISKRVQLTK